MSTPIVNTEGTRSSSSASDSFGSVIDSTARNMRVHRADAIALSTSHRVGFIFGYGVFCDFDRLLKNRSAWFCFLPCLLLHFAEFFGSRCYPSVSTWGSCIPFHSTTLWDPLYEATSRSTFHCKSLLLFLMLLYFLKLWWLLYISFGRNSIFPIISGYRYLSSTCWT